jgi:ornithine cyclodeaminase
MSAADTEAMLVLTEAEVDALLDLDDLRRAVAAAMVDVSAETVSMPPRTGAFVPDTGMLAAMPAYLPSVHGLAAKLVTLFPGNASGALPTHQALVIVFDAQTGRPTALLDGTAITTARTAAGSALSVELLARPEAEVLAVLGTGVQARAHVEAVRRVRRIAEVRIAGRSDEHAVQLASDLSQWFDVPARAADFVDACAGADIICVTTASLEPVLHRDMLDAGSHVASVGFTTTGRELASDVVANALVVVESRAAALAPSPSGSNDLRTPVDEGLLDPAEIVEVGELLAGARAGRTSDQQITVYKSVGVAAQDVAAAHLVLAAAKAAGVGTTIDI